MEVYSEKIGKQHEFDVFIPTDEKNAKFVGMVVDYIRKNIPDAQIIYIVAKASLFNKINRHTKDVVLIDEDKMLEGLEFGTVWKYMAANGVESINGVGWYYQQLLKFGFALTPYCKDYYLTWDSDTLPISELHFFNDGKPLFTMKSEYHQPYFDTMQRLIGLGKVAPKSFIAEHMIFKKEYVVELIAEIEHKGNGENWIERIIKSCDFSLRVSAFSEFETYGTFCMVHHPGAYGEQYLNTFRGAAIIRGRHVTPDLCDVLSRDVDIASFELADERFPYNWDFVKHQLRRKLRRLQTTPVNKWMELLR